MSLVRNVLAKRLTLCLSTDHPAHLNLFRTIVSRTAADKAGAVLEGVGLDEVTISSCFTRHPLNAEETVQAGLIKWKEGQGLQPPTWAVLLKAMAYAQIDQQHIQRLKLELGLFGMSFVSEHAVCECMCACMCAGARGSGVRLNELSESSV